MAGVFVEELFIGAMEDLLKSRDKKFKEDDIKEMFKKPFCTPLGEALKQTLHLDHLMKSYFQGENKEDVIKQLQSIIVGYESNIMSMSLANDIQYQNTTPEIDAFEAGLVGNLRAHSEITGRCFSSGEINPSHPHEMDHLASLACTNAMAEATLPFIDVEDATEYAAFEDSEGPPQNMFLSIIGVITTLLQVIHGQQMNGGLEKTNALKLSKMIMQATGLTLTKTSDLEKTVIPMKILRKLFPHAAQQPAEANTKQISRLYLNQINNEFMRSVMKNISYAEKFVNQNLFRSRSMAIHKTGSKAEINEFIKSHKNGPSMISVPVGHTVSFGHAKYQYSDNAHICKGMIGREWILEMFKEQMVDFLEMIESFHVMAIQKNGVVQELPKLLRRVAINMQLAILKTNEALKIPSSRALGEIIVPHLNNDKVESLKEFLGVHLSNLPDGHGDRAVLLSVFQFLTPASPPPPFPLFKSKGSGPKDKERLAQSIVKQANIFAQLYMPHLQKIHEKIDFQRKLVNPASFVLLGGIPDHLRYIIRLADVQDMVQNNFTGLVSLLIQNGMNKDLDSLHDICARALSVSEHSMLTSIFAPQKIDPDFKVPNILGDIAGIYREYTNGVHIPCYLQTLKCTSELNQSVVMTIQKNIADLIKNGKLIDTPLERVQRLLYTVLMYGETDTSMAKLAILKTNATVSLIKMMVTENPKVLEMFMVLLFGINSNKLNDTIDNIMGMLLPVQENRDDIVQRILKEGTVEYKHFQSILRGVDGGIEKFAQQRDKIKEETEKWVQSFGISTYPK